MPTLQESEFHYNGLTFNSPTSPWIDVKVTPSLLPKPRIEVVGKLGADGAWVTSLWKSELAFLIQGQYAADPASAFTDMYGTFAAAFAPRTDDTGLYFRLPGMSTFSIQCRPQEGLAFATDRLLSLGQTEWAVSMIAGDATWISGDPP